MGEEIGMTVKTTAFYHQLWVAVVTRLPTVKLLICQLFIPGSNSICRISCLSATLGKPTATHNKTNAVRRKFKA